MRSWGMLADVQARIDDVDRAQRLGSWADLGSPKRTRLTSPLMVLAENSGSTGERQQEGTS